MPPYEVLAMCTTPKSDLATVFGLMVLPVFILSTPAEHLILVSVFRENFYSNILCIYCVQLFQSQAQWHGMAIGNSGTTFQWAMYSNVQSQSLVDPTRH